MTRPDEDDVWRSIVENYGERPTLDDPDDTPEGSSGAAAPRTPAPDPPPAAPAYDDPEDRFVPPPAPPFPRPRGLRGVAWIGIFGAPLLVLVGVVVPVDLPAVLDLALVAWFVGSFVYLVVTMRRTPRDPWDDGSRV